MRLWSKTILSIVSVTILLGTLVLLHPFLLPPLVEYRLHRYAKKHWGAALQAERASRDGSHWVLEKLVFTQEATGKVLLTVERAEFGYTLHLLARQLELQVKIDNPHLILHSASHESPRSKGWPIPTFGLLAAMLNTQGKIAIDGGKLSLADRETTPLAFSFHGGWDKHFRGKGQLHFTDDRLVKASIAPEHNHVQLQQADCAVLAALLGPAWIDPSWLQVTDGMVSGQFTFHHHLLQGNLVFENLQVRHPLLHLEGRYPSLTFQGDAATGTAMLTQPASLTWRANSLHPFQLQMQTGMISCISALSLHRNRE